MSHFHQAAPSVAFRAETSVPLARLLGLGVVRGRIGLLGIIFGENVFGGFGRRSQKEAEQSLDGGRVVVDNLLQMPNVFGQSLDELVVLLKEGPLLHPTEKHP